MSAQSKDVLQGRQERWEGEERREEQPVFDQKVERAGEVGAGNVEG